ncbi:histidine phosphatase family protein [Rosenbergiella collisarenosi]|uniref:histidine phosphatase family protein n=1 Tax=Rosenbergiella collisarenosi TaxID=1544695 RepID=UPI001F4D4B26|nr:histidine phosphatase family protein [Rosenbergiella collisarenosi]
MKVILVRHAETDWNVKRIIQGHSDSSLTPKGLRETSALLAALTIHNYQVECVYTSPLNRALHMGRSLSDHFLCPLIIEPALKEQSFGQFEGMSLDLVMKHYPKEANELFKLNPEFRPVGGESLAESSQRIVHFIYNLEKTSPHETICVVSHGRIIQGIVTLLKERTLNNFPEYTQPNASYTLCDLVNGECIALRWGIASHLLKI